MSAQSSAGATSPASAHSAANAGLHELHVGEVPSEYVQPADRQGRVERLEYDTRNWAYDPSELLRKTALVYVPYGYDACDEARRYDVLYLMHGRARSAEYFLTWGNGALKNMLDHMVAAGDMPPVLVVTPTYKAHEDDDLGYTEEARALRPFTKELRGDLMPALAAAYRTYAQSGAPESLEAARDHCAFGGFSFGAVTTWYVLMHCADLLRYYLPFCGDCWAVSLYGGTLRPGQTTDRIIKGIQRAGRQADDFCIFCGSGTYDPMHQSVKRQVQSMRTRGEMFTADNLTYRVKTGGRHDYGEALEFLYQTLPKCFKPAAI